MSPKKDLIRVLVVDDSPVVCKVLTSLLNADPNVIVVGTAHTGQEAVALVPKLKPDLITMDIHMPVMDGLEATKQIMADHPTPIMVVSTSIFKMGTEKAFKMIACGALDVLEKALLDGDPVDARELVEKVKFLAQVKVIPHPLGRLERRKLTKVPASKPDTVQTRVVGIVSSTGGPQALLALLKRLPQDFPCGIAVVQHITDGFLEGLVEWLGEECDLRIKIAEHGEHLRPGTVFFAPCDRHMRIAEGGRILCTDEPAYEGHRPSGNILLESIARLYRQRAMGIILTGMGRDGAAGLKAIRQMGGATAVQDERTSAVFGMPKAAIEFGAAELVLPPDQIPEAIARWMERFSG